MRTDIANSVTADYIVTEVLSDTYDDTGILKEKCYRWLFRIWTRLNLSMLRKSRTVILPIAPGTKTMMLPPDYQDFIFLGFPDGANMRPIAVNRNLVPQIGIENENVCETCGHVDLCSLDMQSIEEIVTIDGVNYPKTTTRLIHADGSYTEEVTEPVVQYLEQNPGVVPPTPATQLHGVQIDNGAATIDKIGIVHSLNVNAVRMAIYIQGNVGDVISGMQAYMDYIDFGVKVMLNINWQPSAGGPYPWQTDMTAYAGRLNEALDIIQAVGGPELISIENEYFNSDYHQTDTAGVNQYITILQTAAPLVRARGYKVTDSGLNSKGLCATIYRQLVSSGQASLAAQFGAAAFTPAEKNAIDTDTVPPILQTANDDQDTLMNAVIATCDLLNLHYYEISNPNVDPATNAAANQLVIQTIAAFINDIGGTKMVFNEYGIRNNFQTNLVTSLLYILDSVKNVVVMCSFFSGAAGEPAIPLCDDNPPYALTPAGTAFAAWHGPVVLPRSVQPTTVEMQTTKKVVCQLDKSCAQCVPATPGNLAILTGCGCSDALCCCSSNDLLTYDVKPSNVHYNLFEEEGFIQFSPSTCINKAILKYVSSGLCIKGVYYFPIAAMETLIAGTYYRSIEKKKNVPQNEKDRARKAFTAERKELLRDFTRLSYQEWLELLDVVPRLPTL